MNVEELIENFELLPDWEDRYAYLIDLGRKLPPMQDSDKNDVTKVDGCMSQVWMTSEINDAGRLQITADSDAHIVRGLIAVLLVIFSGKTPDEIRQTQIAPIFQKLELENHISPNRRNGFYAMVQRIESMAERHAA